MGKKKAIMIFKGSTKKHWIRYVTALEMAVNPTATYGVNQSFRMLKLIATVDPKFLQPGFSFKHEFISQKPYNYPSFMTLKFVNGQERQIDMNLSTLDAITDEVEYINDLVEFERSFNGQDDELDDEV
jgi:hypothetical protein